MTRLSRTIASAMLGAVMLTAAGGAASAHITGGGGGMTGGGGGHFGGGHFGHHYGYIGLDDDGYYDSGYGSGCRYLRYKAHETGRPYWWRRYHACLDG